VAADDIVVRKVFRRLMWFIFILQIPSFIDRINIGFAGLSMNKTRARAIAIAPSSFGMYVRSRVPWHRPEDHAPMVEGLRKAGREG
jgi:hypothetical protein